jgi:hypothetical protein
VPEWTKRSWLEEVETWIRGRVEVAGALDQFHVRWWSTVIRVPTRGADVYFKAVAPGFMFEPALTARLFELSPDRVTPIIEIDAARGWMLMRDAGRRLRELVTTRDDLQHWELALARYAELQLAAMPLRDELLELAVPDSRLAALSARLRAVLTVPVRGLTSAEQGRALAAVPELERLCHELAAYGVAETIEHNDLHDGQVFSHGGRYVFFDWGDSCVSHPFHTLTVTLRAAASKLELEPGGRELLRLRDAYLEPFGGPRLHEAADLAYRTGTVARAPPGIGSSAPASRTQSPTTTSRRHMASSCSSSAARSARGASRNAPLEARSARVRQRRVRTAG